MEYLTDEVGEDYKTWKLNDMVFLFAGTGSGKTHFCLEQVSLYNIEQGRDVLYLVPRKILMQQVKKDIARIFSRNPATAPVYNQSFTVWTYQYLENCLLRNCPVKKLSVRIFH